MRLVAGALPHRVLAEVLHEGDVGSEERGSVVARCGAPQGLITAAWERGWASASPAAPFKSVRDFGY